MTDKLTVGEVLKPQGIRGELKIKPFTDDAEVFCAFSRVFVGDTPYKVLSVRTGGGAVFLGLKGVADRNAAELLRGKQVYVLREEAPFPRRADIISPIFSAAGSSRSRARRSARSRTCGRRQRIFIPWIWTERKCFSPRRTA